MDCGAYGRYPGLLPEIIRETLRKCKRLRAHRAYAAVYLAVERNGQAAANRPAAPRAGAGSEPAARRAAAVSVEGRPQMPLYEYTCRGCGHTFEALVRSGSTASCPACQSQDLERLLSLFAVDSDGTRKANLAAGRRHLRKEQVDRQVADREEIEHHRH
jgi:putative FmdB family regulatory protein